MGNLIGGYLGRETGTYMRDQELVMFSIPPAILIVFIFVNIIMPGSTPPINSQAVSKLTSSFMLFISALVFSIPSIMLALNTDDFDTTWENVLFYGLGGLSLICIFIVYNGISAPKGINDGRNLWHYRAWIPFLFTAIIYFTFAIVGTTYMDKTEGFVDYAKYPKELELQPGTEDLQGFKRYERNMLLKYPRRLRGNQKGRHHLLKENFADYAKYPKELELQPGTEELQGISAPFKARSLLKYPNRLEASGNDIIKKDPADMTIGCDTYLSGTLSPGFVEHESVAEAQALARKHGMTEGFQGYAKNPKKLKLRPGTENLQGYSKPFKAHSLLKYPNRLRAVKEGFFNYAKNPGEVSLDVQGGIPSILKAPVGKYSRERHSIKDLQGLPPFEAHEPRKYLLPDNSGDDIYNQVIIKNFDAAIPRSETMKENGVKLHHEKTVQDEAKLWEMLEQQQEDNRYARIQFGYLNLKENDMRRIKRYF